MATLDNTRLFAANFTKTPVVANVHHFDEVLPAMMRDRFETDQGVPTTWGLAVLFRIGKQSKKYKEKYPEGSFNTGVKDICFKKS